MATKTIHTSGKRKRAIARASIKNGRGRIRINNQLLETIQPKSLRLKIEEPLILVGGLSEKVDISVRVAGGGSSSQTDAVRLAIARALVEHSKSEELKECLESYDRQLLVADVRRKEPAKPNSHGQARAKHQKSYR